MPCRNGNYRLGGYHTGCHTQNAWLSLPGNLLKLPPKCINRLKCQGAVSTNSKLNRTCQIKYRALSEFIGEK